jgi:hypothetical protein
MENKDIVTQLKELDHQLNQKYREVCALNDERIEKEYTLKQRLNDMADILEQKYTLLYPDKEELEKKLKDVYSEICNYRSFEMNEHIR